MKTFRAKQVKVHFAYFVQRDQHGIIAKDLILSFRCIPIIHLSTARVHLRPAKTQKMRPPLSTNAFFSLLNHYYFITFEILCFKNSANGVIASHIVTISANMTKN